MSKRFLKNGDVRKIRNVVRRGFSRERNGNGAVVVRGEIGAHVAPPDFGGNAFAFGTALKEVNGTEGVRQGRHGMRHGDVVVVKRHGAFYLGIPGVQKRNLKVQRQVAGAGGRRTVKSAFDVPSHGTCGDVVKHESQLILRLAVDGERNFGRRKDGDYGAGGRHGDAVGLSGVGVDRHAGAFKSELPFDFFEKRPFSGDKRFVGSAAVTRYVIDGDVMNSGGNEETPVVFGFRPRKFRKVPADFKHAVGGRSPG